MNLFSPPREGFERAKYYAEKALALNGELGAAHYVLGQVNFWYRWDFSRSKSEYEQAEHSPTSFYFTGVTVDPWYDAFGFGDYNTAVAKIHRILETDPLSFHAQLHLGFFYTFGGEGEKAREVLKRMLTVVPTFSEAERLIAYSYLLEGDREKALTHAKSAAEMAQGMGWAQTSYLIALAASGHHDEARAGVVEMEKQKGPLSVSPLGVGLVHSWLGDLDKAFDKFNEALEFRDIWCVAFKHSHEFDHVRHDPRFQVLLDRIGYPG